MLHSGERLLQSTQTKAGQGSASISETTQMDAKQEVLFNLFDQNHFYVLPAYQRDYSWKKEPQAEQLLSDIWEAADQAGVNIRSAFILKIFWPDAL